MAYKNRPTTQQKRYGCILESARWC